jgi:ATP-dependent DNA ligase
MDAEQVDKIPEGPEWQYEPKWDGFRCLVFRDAQEVELQAKSGKLLTRFFPEVADFVRSVPVRCFVIDSELVIPVDEELSFEHLQMRLHPAESRVRKLSIEHPATVIAFDLLVDGEAEPLTSMPFRERRKRLEILFGRAAEDGGRLRLSPSSTDVKKALQWFSQTGGALDGIVAKRLDLGYRSGERTGMVKYKNIRTVDCVVGGFRYLAGKRLVGSLLLGLYGDDGRLHHVGYTSSIKADDRPGLTKNLEALRKTPGFTGRSPGGPSRWAPERSGEWEPVKPELVIEVTYDHMSGGRFRHGTKFIRWRPDKSPLQCTFDQVERKTLKRLLSSSTS